MARCPESGAGSVDRSGAGTSGLGRRRFCAPHDRRIKLPRRWKAWSTRSGLTEVLSEIRWEQTMVQDVPNERLVAFSRPAAIHDEVLEQMD